MPFYEYVCSRCEEPFEELRFADSPPPRCPACDTEEVRRVPSAFSVGRSPTPAPRGAGPCGRCGDPRGPGACARG